MKQLFAFLLCILLFLTSCANNEVLETPTPTLTATPTIEVTPTETPVPVLTVTPTATPEATATPEPTPSPTPTPVPTPTPSPTPVPIDPEKFTIMYIASSSVNVREGSSTKTKKLTTLSLNTEVKAYLLYNNWYYVGFGENSFGYISAKLLSEQPIVTPSPTPLPTPMPTRNPEEYKNNGNTDINDNVFLDALEYTGYNLKKHRDDGNMWVFILGKYKEGLGYLSGLGYDYGRSSGYETNAQGLPDIERFRKNGGLVCASYVTYVYFNYLPNVAGIDTSHLTRPVNPTSAQGWREAAEDWVKKGLSRKISFSASRRSDGTVIFNPYEQIPVGSIVVFKVYNNSDSAPARHVGIYAGYQGGYHWMTHVGNERGPEMITMERMGFSSTPEIPLEIITPPINW